MNNNDQRSRIRLVPHPIANMFLHFFIGATKN